MIGVVPGKEIKSAVVVDKCGIALRSTRLLGFLNVSSSFLFTILITITFVFSFNLQVMHWRSGHKVACQQLKVSSQTAIHVPNSNGTTLVESKKGQWSRICRLLQSIHAC